MSEGLMLGWLVGWPGVCVSTHAWICVFVGVCVHVCLSSYLIVCEPLQ